MQDGRLKLLAKHSADLEKIVDIGYAEIPNSFLNNPNIIGYDLQSKPCPSNYKSVIQDDAFNLKNHFGENSLDGIVAGEFFEHVENPIEFLRIAYSVIKPGGKLIISTPNPHYPPEIVLNTIWNFRFMFDETHVCVYPQRWLLRMFNLGGFKDVKISSGGISFPFNIGVWIPFPRAFAQYTIVVATK